MKNLIKNKIILLMIAIFAVSINAEYRIGVDYRIADNPLPVKKDGIVEVTESFWYGCMHVINLSQQSMIGLQNKTQM